MDEQGYLQFLKKNNRSERVSRGYLNCMQRFESFLAQCGKDLSQATPDDLEAFASYAKEIHTGIGYLGIADYYEWTRGEEIRWAAHALFAQENLPKYKLSEMLGIPPEVITCLKLVNIQTAADMLDAGYTHSKRQKLAIDTGIPYEVILEIVKLSDLARVGGLKTRRGRLYYDAGYDTLEKIAAADPEILRQQLADYITATHFPGIPPTPKEAANAVHVARFVQKLVDF